jgi:glucose/arabinose dehydrogenase
MNKQRLAKKILLAALCTGSLGNAADLPSGFEHVLFVRDLGAPTSMTFAPDGRLFVSEKHGKLLVIKNGRLLDTPFLEVQTVQDGERGLQGIAFDPNFAANRYLYVFYTFASGPRNRISRFRASSANPDVVESGSEVVLVDNMATNDFHNGGSLHFGLDGMLYASTGQAQNSSLPQQLSKLEGKMLRIDPSSYPNIIPPDNPFVNTSGARGEIWARGLRNPFTFAIDRVTGKMFINDVGAGSWEEVNLGAKGANYGWPNCEGACSNSNYQNPAYTYSHTEASCVAGGVFYRANQFPNEYVGDYFFADYTEDWIRRLDVATNQVTTFATRLNKGPIDLDIGPEGSLYYLSLSNSSAEPSGFDGKIYKINYVGSGNRTPIAVASANPTFGAAPLTVSFSGEGSSDPDGDPLTYTWNFDDGSANKTGKNVTHVYNTNGKYNAKLTVDDGRGASSESEILEINVGAAPVATITSPAEGALYAGGDNISYSGSGTDAEDGTLPASAFSWTVIFHHDEHTHPFLGPIDGVKSGSFVIPHTGETADNVFYRIMLNVTDSDGLTNTTSRDILPRKSTFTLDSDPPGLQLHLDGQPKTAPLSIVGVVGITRTISAPSPQALNGQTYEFVSWSDGEAQTHSFDTPEVNTTYLATYRLTVLPPPAIASFNPASGPVGTEVTIAGTSFTGATEVAFDATPTMVYLVDSDTQIRANVPSGASTGKISVTTGSGTAVSANDFTVGASAGSALKFDGSNDYLQISDNALLSGGPGKSITVEAWAKMDATNGTRPIVEKFLDGSTKDWGLQVIDGILEVSIESSNDNWTLRAGSLAVGVWRHVAFAFDNGANIVRSFIDGAEAGQKSLNKDMPDTKAVVRVGRHGYASQYLLGEVDEVRIWNYARTATQILADKDHELAGTETGLIGYWPFNEGSGQSANDRTANGNHWRLGSSTSGDASDPLWVNSTAPIGAGGPPTPMLRLLIPNGGESWSSGSNQSIAWNSQGSIPNVQLDYSTNNGANWSTIAVSTPNDGSYNWTVPSTPSSQSLVRVSDATDGSPVDVSDGLFAIVSTPAPEITSFNPQSGAPGAQITITGANFTGATAVKFNGTAASSFAIDSDTQIEATVPAVATTGKISVSTSAGTGFSATDFTVTSGGGSTTLRFQPTHDAYVKSSTPTTSYGSAATLRLRKSGSETINTYVKFDLSGVSGTLQSAKLRLYVTDGGPDGGAVYVVSNYYEGTTTAWTQGGLNWSNAPAIGRTSLSTAGAISAGTWVELDVTVGVSGNGTYSFALTNNSSDVIYFASKESANRPELVLQVSGATLALDEDIENLSETSSAAPQEFQLAQNYPNPFNPDTHIAYDLPRDASVQLTVFDVLGRQVTTLINTEQKAGHHEIRWDGRDLHGVPVSSGIYFYRLQAGVYQASRKMLLMR